MRINDFVYSKKLRYKVKQLLLSVHFATVCTIDLVTSALV